jgi:O-antigen biosynthesis protein WbqV
MLSFQNEELVYPLLAQRPKVAPEAPFLESLHARRVMVTGAGGSIGADLSLEIAAHRPAALTLVDQCELNLYEIDTTLANSELVFPVVPVIADVRDWFSMNRLFAAARPEIVFHAAALKHVPLLESAPNLVEAAATNVEGTLLVAELCALGGAELVFISTDKAVNPSSAMGLTKRAAERGLADVVRHHPELRLSIVRFGNVLGSSGSVVPLFRRQIAHGGPVTVTHPEMTRFVMSIKEAVYLVLQATVARPTGAGAWLYVLDMGKPMLIVELAESLIRMTGLRPHRDVAIAFVGLRPGEKLHEELSYEAERLEPTGIEGIRGTPVAAAGDEVMRQLTAVIGARQRRDADELRAALAALVPEYTGQAA